MGWAGFLLALVLGVIVDLPCLRWFWPIWLCLVVIGFMIGCGFCFVGVGIIQILVDLWVILLDLAVWWVLVIWVGLLRSVVFFVLAMLLASSLYFRVVLRCGCLVLRFFG